MDRRCIIICDSGIGGMGLLKRLAKTIKGQVFLYYADFKNMPYGEKDKEELVKIAKANCSKFLSFSPKLILFACNTLSVNTLNENLCQSVKIERVLPKVKSFDRGLLLCTEATAKSDYVKSIQDKNPLLDVMPMKGFASEIEDYFFTGKKLCLDKLFDGAKKDYDYISLGCTHYSLVKKEIGKYFPNCQILSGEDEVFEKFVFSVTTFNLEDKESEVCFVGKRAEELKSLYNKGVF